MDVDNVAAGQATSLANAHGSTAQDGLTAARQPVSNPATASLITPVPGGLAPWQVKRVMAHVETHMADTLRLDEVAALVKLSSSYFSAAFRRSFGVSPYAYIIGRRVDFAKQRMLEGNTPLCQIALECGLADQAHLSRIFRRVTGATPTAWRRRQKRHAADDITV